MTESVPASISTFGWITEVHLAKDHNQINLGHTSLVFGNPDAEVLAQVEALAAAAVELAERIRAQIGGKW